MPFYDLLTYHNFFLFGQKFNQPKLPIKWSNKKNHPSHNEHVKIDLSKMMEWFFLCLFKLGIFLLDLLIKKIPCFLVVIQETQQPKPNWVIR